MINKTPKKPPGKPGVGPIDQRILTFLAMLRNYEGLSQAKMAEILEVSTTQYIKYEKYINRIPASGLYRLCRHFKIPMRAFFFNYPLMSDQQLRELMHDFKQETYVQTCFHRLSLDGKDRLIDHLHSIIGYAKWDAEQPWVQAHRLRQHLKETGHD